MGAVRICAIRITVVLSFQVNIWLPTFIDVVISYITENTVKPTQCPLRNSCHLLRGSSNLLVAGASKGNTLAKHGRSRHQDPNHHHMTCNDSPTLITNIHLRCLGARKSTNYRLKRPRRSIANCFSFWCLPSDAKTQC